MRYGSFFKQRSPAKNGRYTLPLWYTNSQALQSVPLRIPQYQSVGTIFAKTMSERRQPRNSNLIFKCIILHSGETWQLYGNGSLWFGGKTFPFEIVLKSHWLFSDLMREILTWSFVTLNACTYLFTGLSGSLQFRQEHNRRRNHKRECPSQHFGITGAKRGNHFCTTQSWNPETGNSSYQICPSPHFIRSQAIAE